MSMGSRLMFLFVLSALVFSSLGIGVEIAMGLGADISGNERIDIYRKTNSNSGVIIPFLSTQVRTIEVDTEFNKDRTTGLIISSLAGLDEFKSMIEYNYYHAFEEFEEIDFKIADFFGKFNENFFSDNVIIAMLVPHYSSSYHTQVDYVTKNDQEIFIGITTVHPDPDEDGNFPEKQDIVPRRILIEVQKAYVEGVTEFSYVEQLQPRGTPITVKSESELHQAIKNGLTDITIPSDVTITVHEEMFIGGTLRNQGKLIIDAPVVVSGKLILGR